MKSRHLQLKQMKFLCFEIEHKKADPNSTLGSAEKQSVILSRLKKTFTGIQRDLRREIRMGKRCRRTRGNPEKLAVLAP